jgi:hypothetical protein
VFVIPGILGSHLKHGDKRIWLSLRLVGGLSRLAYEPGSALVQPDGAIGMVYDDLMDHLAATHEVVEFSFDWRRPLEDEAARLADAVDAELDRRSASGQPVRIVAHSMGGVLTRTMQIVRPATFERLMKREGARFLMLGTPNGGSWAPMQVLSGDDTFGNALAAFGSPLRDRQARQLMAAFPGFMQLQADLLDTRLGLDKSSTWQQLAAEDLKRVQDCNWWHRGAGEAADAAYEWGVPPQDVLDQAVALRRKLDAQLQTGSDGAFGRFVNHTLLVVGDAELTPDGYEWGPEGFVYLNSRHGGDGRVLEADGACLQRQWQGNDHGRGGAEKHAPARDSRRGACRHRRRAGRRRGCRGYTRAGAGQHAFRTGDGNRLSFIRVRRHWRLAGGGRCGGAGCGVRRLARARSGGSRRIRGRPAATRR